MEELKLEVLFPELCHLYGDLANIRYIESSVPGLRAACTGNLETPLFSSQRVDMIYIGSMPENRQELAISRLEPHRERLLELIEDGVVLLATGNALELFGTYIEDGARRIPALDFFPFFAKRDMGHRHNSMFLGKFGDMEIVGSRSQFSFCYGQFAHPFLEVTGGCGINPDAKIEGLHYRNFFATYLLGPFLIWNPHFTKYLLRLTGWEGPLAYEKQMLEAYNCRLEQFKTPGFHFFS